MPDGTSLLLLIGGLLVVLVVGGIVWWVNRTPGGRRSAHAADLPLYSVTLPSGVTEAPDAPPPPAASAPRSTPRAKEARPVNRAAEAPQSRGASPTPRAQPPVPVPPRAAPPPTPSSEQTDDDVAPRAQIREFTTGRKPTPSGGRRAVPTPSAASPAPSSPATPPSAVPTPAVPTPSVSTPSVPTAAGERAITAHGVPGTEVEGHLVKFSVPQDGTLQFLPGRLQILDGQDAGREVRFVRVPGPDGTTVTFGRSEGPAYRHIQLREATVSRAHARLRLDGATWHLTNLSETNPVVINARTMAAGEETPVADGDRIEMGEVVFGFRSK
jgi:hypothetical protein